MKKTENNPNPASIRQKAEELFKKKSEKNEQVSSESDCLKLIHELEVHKIELELINEELRRAKEQAEFIAEKYAELYYAPLGYFTLSNNGKIVELNFNGAQMLGSTRSNLIGKSFISFISADTLSIFNLFISQITKDKIIESCELTLSVINKNHIYVYLNGLFRNDSNQIQIIAVDITARKNAENESNRLLSELKKAQSKLRIALESGSIGIWDWNLETHELVWDERTERMFGLTPGSFGKTVRDFEALVNEEDLSHIHKATDIALKNNFQYETVFRIKSGGSQPKYISSKALVNKNEEGVPIGMTGVYIDITGFTKDTEQLVIKLNEELLRSNKDLEYFAYVASHDLQEPLRSVTSFTQLLEKQYGDKLDEKAHEYIRFAVDGARRMYDLLNGLLEFSRISIKEKLFSKTDMNQIVDYVIKNLSLFIDEKHVDIKSDKLPVINADMNQMVHLFQNLIVNAIKFNDSPPEVSITSETGHTHYVFCVKDNGPGIEPQYHERIFQIFQRLNPTKNEGTGIGLAICKRIVERHGGNIWVESKPGKGSAFFFSIQK